MIKTGYHSYEEANRVKHTETEKTGTVQGLEVGQELSEDTRFSYTIYA